MEEIKVGEYIRTFDGLIAKLIKIKDDDEFSYNYYICDNDSANCLRSMIVKHSNNIIDLIEVGDYVNGVKVINILYKDEKKLPTIIKCISEKCFKEKDIKSIVTKEQFANIEYRIGENNE